MTDTPAQAETSHIGQTRAWSGQRVAVVAEIPGWVFVIPQPPSPPGRPFSIATAHWTELPDDAD